MGRANVGIFARALHPVGRGDRLGGAYRGRRYLAISQIGLRASLQLSWRFRIERRRRQCRGPSRNAGRHANTLSPAVPVMRPLCEAIRSSTIDRWLVNVASVETSSRSMCRL
jgi:hypothetical protein